MGWVTTGPSERSGVPNVGTKVAVAVLSACAPVPTSENATSTVPKLTRLLSGITSPRSTRCGSFVYRSTLAATATATFVPTFGTPERSDGPVVTQPNEGRGVYEATDVVFDTPGVWVAEVTADVKGLGPQTAQASFAVQEQPSLPAPGDRAQPTENLTVDSKGVPLAAIDSRAASKGSIPDPELHEWTIARAIAEGRPALVVFATPAFCISRFCGPVTEMVEDLSRRYADRAVFIHIEIWKDFQKQVLNQAALDWLRMPSGDLTEPWLFLIGADGTIADRWSSMWSEAEVETELEALPPMRG